MLSMLAMACQQKPTIEVDYLFINGKIYTADSAYSIAEALVVRNDSILDFGNTKDIQSKYYSKNTFDLTGKTMYPGLIDAHCHFFAYGQDLQELNLKQTVSFEDMINQTVKYAQTNNPSFIIGRGWNEETWESKSTIANFKLNALFPNIPVVLQRIDGHAVLCNQVALDMAGITSTMEIAGGSIEKMGGFITGVLVDKAAGLVFDILPELNYQQKIRALLDAQEACFKVGLTTVSDAGLPRNIVLLIDSLQKSNDLKMRVYAMANPVRAELEAYIKQPIHSDRLRVNSVKLYADGSLGSRGALLKKAYCDHEGHFGLIQNNIDYYKDITAFCYQNNWQVNTHCIGDSANALLLNLYASYLKGPNDRRWRIEHAQVVDPSDMHIFKDFSIIPSVQPTHATSDMEMAVKRICDSSQMLGAYSYKQLLQQNNYIAFGTDFPVEGISPLATYFAAVNRTASNGQVFKPEEAMTSQEAVLGMTRWAAYANFMEKEVGSIQRGKRADLVILSNDLSYCKTLSDVDVLLTMLNGETVYQSSKIQKVSKK